VACFDGGRHYQAVVLLFLLLLIQFPHVYRRHENSAIELAVMLVPPKSKGVQDFRSDGGCTFY
jgi:hypothetical protein